MVSIFACSDRSPTNPRPPRTVLVDPYGSGVFETIQAAIDASAHGDTIELANARYRGNGNRDLDFKGRRLTLRSQRRNPLFCIIDCDGTPEAPHRAFWFHSDESSQSVLESVTLEDGYASDAGALVRCEGGSSPTIRGVLFSKSHTRAVVAIASSPVLDGCQFVQNLEGALSCVDDSDVTLIGCSFEGNYSEGSGAAILVREASLYLDQCQLIGNSAFFSGGAIFGTSAAGVNRTAITALNCRFFNNTAGYHGGAVHVVRSDIAFAFCVFSDNVAGTNGGAVFSDSETSGSFINVTFVANTSAKGAALACGSLSSPELDKAILAFNSGGAPVYCDAALEASGPEFGCSDIYGNEVGDWVDCIADQASEAGNFSEDPLFCDVTMRVFQLQPASPCAPSDLCNLIGAQQVGCYSLSGALVPNK